MLVTHGLEGTDVERNRHRRYSGFAKRVEGNGLFRLSVRSAHWKCLDEARQQLPQRLDHAFLARDDDRDRVPCEQLRAYGLEPRDQPRQRAFIELGELAHDVQHPDPLEPVVEGAL